MSECLVALKKKCKARQGMASIYKNVSEKREKFSVCDETQGFLIIDHIIVIEHSLEKWNGWVQSVQKKKKKVKGNVSEKSRLFSESQEGTCSININEFN